MPSAVTAADVIAAADRLEASAGLAAVSLRRVRAEIGRGSLQTIHRHLAGWRANRAIVAPVAAIPPSEDLGCPVRMIPAVVDSRDWNQVIDPLRGRGGEVDIRKGVPGGLVHVHAPHAEDIANDAGIPFARGLIFLRPDHKSDRKSGRTWTEWERDYAEGILVPGGAAEIVLALCDDAEVMETIASPNGYTRRRAIVQAAYGRMQRERAEIHLQLDAALYQQVEAKARQRGKSIRALLTEAIQAVVS